VKKAITPAPSVSAFPPIMQPVIKYAFAAGLDFTAMVTKLPNNQLRWLAMKALGRSGSATAVKTLTELLDDTSANDQPANKDAEHHDWDCALAALVNGKGKTRRSMACAW
jgi:hypothetical protein